MQTAQAAVSHGNLFSSSEHSSVETLFSSPTNLSSLGSSQNGNHFIRINITLDLETVTKQIHFEACHFPVFIVNCINIPLIDMV